MATIIVPNFNTVKEYTGLNTYQYTVTAASMHNCSIKVEHRDASTMTISIVQAGSNNATLVTTTLVPATNVGDPKSVASLNVIANCSIGDTLSFVLTSSTAIDNNMNTVKATINVHQGGLN
jgi:hypothetical protein